MHCLCLARQSDNSPAIRIAKLFLKHDPCLLTTEDSCGYTPVADALRAGNIPLMKFLCSQSSQPKQLLQKCDKLGRQAIHIASEVGRVRQRLDLFILFHSFVLKD